MFDRFNIASLQLRTLSALVIAPIFLAILYFGGWIFAVLMVLTAGLALYEWYHMAKRIDECCLWQMLGVFYVLFSFSSFYLMRELFDVWTVVLFALMIFGSDIGAYFFGKIIGGPKMAVTISPNKTWAGMGGAVAVPALVFMVGDMVQLHIYPWWGAFIIGALIGVVGQIGDLLISYVKRLAEIKDTGSLIPGHGGVLDRVDAMMLAAPVFLMILLVTLAQPLTLLGP